MAQAKKQLTGPGHSFWNVLEKVQLEFPHSILKFANGKFGSPPNLRQRWADATAQELLACLKILAGRPSGVKQASTSKKPN